jgi:undecaprenyl-diphosphatase
MRDRFLQLIDYITPKLLGQLTVGALALWVPAAIFVALAEEVVEHEPLLFDEPVLYWLRSIATPDLNQFAVVVTNSGGKIAIAVATLAIAYLLYRRRFGRRAVFTVVFSVAGAALLNLLLKLSFQRDRPDLWDSIVTETSYSFPSGHAMASSALAFSVILVLWDTRWRWMAVTLGIVYFVLVGVSRMYLGVHFPSDVVAGWCVSLAWVALVHRILLRKPVA